MHCHRIIDLKRQTDITYSKQTDKKLSQELCWDVSLASLRGR